MDGYGQCGCRTPKREKALRAFYDAQLSVDAFAWLTRKIEQLAARLFLKPAL